MTADAYKFRAILGQIIVAAWDSDEFLASLQKDPRRILGGYGLQPPPGLQVSIYADTVSIRHVIARPEWGSHGPDFMQKLQREPAAALESIGYTVQDNVEYRVLFNANDHMNIVIPRKPPRHECSIEKIR